ncbi:MAG: beta-xylosidase [Chloroflexi bacterium]|nr:beta-xylosidase [Chloroflexota bacterium]
MIEAIMLWNEPNNLSHWNRDLDPSWERFAEMVCLAGQRLAHISPGLTRVLGGISPLDPGFIRHLFSMGVGDVIDAVGIHGFPLDWNHWHIEEWPARAQAIQAAADGRLLWATEVGASSFVSPGLQAWALDQTAALLVPRLERVYWYALMDLPEAWEATTRHRESEGSAYYRHFRMGLYDAAGRPKLAARRLREWVQAGVGVCEWVYWREEARLAQMVRCLRELGVRRVRTGIGWADWEREGATEWFDHVMDELAEFDLTLTLCFTPAHLGVQPHHTSPPVDSSLFADFCEAVVGRYARRGATTTPIAT